MLLDSFTDMNLSQFNQVKQSQHLVDFIADAEVDRIFKSRDLPKEAFADRRRGLYPIHNAESTCVNYAYFCKNANAHSPEEVKQIESNFRDAALLWDIPEKLAGIKADLSVKKVYTPVKYAFSFAGTNLFPVSTTAQVKAAMIDFENHRSRFPYKMREKIAKEIIEAAENLGWERNYISQAVIKAAGFGLGHRDNLKEELANRLNVLGSSHIKFAEAICNLRDLAATKGPILDNEFSKQAAHIIDSIDNLTGYTERYNVTGFPEEFLFSFTSKTASDMSNGIIRLTNDKSYYLNDLSKAGEALAIIDENKTEMFDIHGSVDLLKVAEILPTLPRPDADLMSSALSQMNVFPTKTTKEAFVKQSFVSKSNSMLQKVASKQPAPITRPSMKRAAAVLDKVAEEQEEQKCKPARREGRFMKTTTPKQQTYVGSDKISQVFTKDR